MSELVTPYCGGCGHLYFHESKISLADAQEKAKTRRCHYCYEDAAEEKKQRRSPKHVDDFLDDLSVDF